MMAAMPARARSLLTVLGGFVVLAAGAWGCGGSEETAPVSTRSAEPAGQPTARSPRPEAKPGSPDRGEPGSNKGRRAEDRSGGSAEKPDGRPTIIAPGHSPREARRILEQLLKGKRPRGGGAAKIRDVGRILRELVSGRGSGRRHPPPGGGAAPSAKAIEEVLNGAK